MVALIEPAVALYLFLEEKSMRNKTIVARPKYLIVITKVRF